MIEPASKQKQNGAMLSNHSESFYNSLGKLCWIFERVLLSRQEEKNKGVCISIKYPDSVLGKFELDPPA